MQSPLTRLADAVPDGTFELGHEGQHAAKDFTERGEIVGGDPASEAEKLVVQNRRGVEHAENVLDRDRRLAIVQFNDHAGHALLAERDQDPPAHDRHRPKRDTVGEGHVQRHGYGYIAKFGHSLEA